MRIGCGSSSQTSAPPSSRLLAYASPPWARATAEVIARPNPVPPRERASSAREKRSKADGRKSAGNPGPSSSTCSFMCPSSRAAESTTSPPP